LRFLRRRLPLLFLSSVLAVSASLGALLVYGLVDVWSAVQITALTALSGLVVLLGLQVRRTVVQIRQLRRVLDRQAREVAEIAGENRAELFGRADALSDRLDTVVESLDELRSEIRDRETDVQVFGGAPVPARVAS
jgi:hypothetical protein